MPKKKNASKAPKLVAPEPPGDEWEACIAWDRVSQSGAAPSFFNGAHVAATDNVFGVRYDVEHPAPTQAAVLTSSSTVAMAADNARALDVYVRAEKALMQARARRTEAADMVDGFKLLQDAEREHTTQEKARLEEEWAATLRGLDTHEVASLKKMEALSDVFFNVMDSAKKRVFELVLKDSEVEDAFAEREATRRHCEEVTDAYYAEHAAHVRAIETLQADMARGHEEELERMTETLQDTALELLVMASQQDNTAEIQQRRTELLEELKKLHARSPQTLREHEDAAGGTEALKRLVELEEQKLTIAWRRQQSLKRSVQALSEAAQSGGPARDGAGPSSTSVARIAPAPAAVIAVSSQNGTGGDGEASLNEVACLRRTLDQTNRDLAQAQERLQHLQNYHFVQLSGAYKPVSIADVGTDGRANGPDDETSAAIRLRVLTSMCTLAASAHAARSGDGATNDEGSSPFLVPPVETLEDRLAIQNYIARQINKLLAGQVLTAPPLTLLSATPLSSEKV